jgi:energy-coupling factor transporter transmembrane protein EcfT
MFGKLNESQIERICNIIESSIEQAATAAIASEARGLAKASE